MAIVLSRAARVSLAVCALYGFTSLTLSLVNKALFAKYGFDAIFTLLTAQMIISWALCVASRDHWGNPLQVPAFSWPLLRRALPIGLVYVANVGVGLLGMRLVNVPMFFAIRKLVSPTLLAYELLVYGKVPEPTVATAVGLIGGGVVVAGWDAFTSDWAGYAVTMLNNVLSAALMVMQKNFNAASKVSPFGMVYLNAIVAGPITAVLALVLGELGVLAEYPYLGYPAFWVSFLLVSCLGLLLTFSSTLCTTYNSPLATSITGNVKDVVGSLFLVYFVTVWNPDQATTSLGWVLFDDGPPVTAKSLGGVLMSFAGAFTYSYANLQKQQQQIQQQQQPQGHGSSISGIDSSTGGSAQDRDRSHLLHIDRPHHHHAGGKHAGLEINGDGHGDGAAAPPVFPVTMAGGKTVIDLPEAVTAMGTPLADGIVYSGPPAGADTGQRSVSGGDIHSVPGLGSVGMKWRTAHNAALATAPDGRGTGAV